MAPEPIESLATKWATPSEYAALMRPPTAGHGEHGAGQPWALTNAFQPSGAWSARYSEYCAEVPDPSDRITGSMRLSRICRPGLREAISGSVHLVSTPVKILL